MPHTAVSFKVLASFWVKLHHLVCALQSVQNVLPASKQRRAGASL